MLLNILWRVPLVSLACMAHVSTVDLTDANLERLLASNPRMLVFFYEPSNGKCLHILPRWDGAARRVRGGIVFAMVNTLKESAVVKKYGVKSVPSIKFVSPGKVEDYTGGIETLQFVQWASRFSTSIAGLDSLVSKLPRVWPFQPSETFCLEDLMRQHRVGTILFVVTSLLQTAVGFWGLHQHSEPRIICWLLCHAGTTSFLDNAILVGRPVVGLVKPYNTVFLGILCTYIAVRLLTLMSSRHDVSTVWAAAVFSVVAILMLRSSADARAAGELDTFLLHHGMWNCLSAIVSAVVVAESRPKLQQQKAD